MKKSFLILGLLLSAVAAKAEKIEGAGKYSHQAGAFENLLVDLVPFRLVGSYSGSMSIDLNRKSGFAEMKYNLGGRDYEASCSAFSIQHITEDLYISSFHEYKMSEKRAEALAALKAKPKTRTQLRATCDVKSKYETYTAPFASDMNFIVDIAGNDFVLMVTQKNSSTTQDYIKGTLTRNDL